MKKVLTAVLTIVLAVALASCGIYKDPIVSPGNGTNGTDETTVPSPGGDDTPGEEGDEFTVSVTFNGAPYKPEIPMQVQWSDGYNFKRADVDENGIARTTGLDGDYNVTLTAVPEGYTYNCNGYKATNDKKNVTVELHQIIPVFGSGTGLYSPNIITISRTGMYRAQLKNNSQIVYYEFKPTRAGTYSIESYMDLTDNRFNPILNVHVGSASWKPTTPTTVINGGGASSSYTSNFRYEVQVDQSMLGCVFAFGIHLDSMDGVYPAYVDFAVQYDGSFSLDFTNAAVMIPQEQFKTKEQFLQMGMVLDGTWTWAETLVGSRYIFDSSMYKINPENGYYYLCDANGNLTNIVLCAYISSAFRFMENPFSTVEYVGNKALTVSEGTENYKLFIEGSKQINQMFLQTLQQNNPDIDLSKVDLTKDGPFAPGHEFAGLDGTQGYTDYCFNGGVYPVTEELKEFLQKYSVNQRMFMDGNGWVECFNPPIYATEADQWLFACGYYLPAGQTTQSVLQGSLTRSATVDRLLNNQLPASQAGTSSPAPAALCPGKCGEFTSVMSEKQSYYIACKKESGTVKGHFQPGARR